MATHRIHIEDARPLATGMVEVGGDEAHHAIRVKRVMPGQAIEVLNGRGHIGAGVVKNTAKDRDGWRLSVAIETVREAPRIRPRIEVCSAAPKGPRLSELIDGLCQVGASSWSMLESERTVSEPGAARVDRLHRIAAEASKQSGRAWHLEIGSPVAFEGAIGGSGVVVADASGAAYAATGAPAIRVLVGPEGGWSDKELQAAQTAGVAIASFGPHVMRIETAAVVAAAIVLDRERHP